MCFRILLCIFLIVFVRQWVVDLIHLGVSFVAGAQHKADTIEQMNE